MSNLFKLLLIIAIGYGGYTWFTQSANNDLANWHSHQFSLSNVQAQFPNKPKTQSKQLQGLNAEFAGTHRAKVEYSVSVVKGKSFNKSDFYPYSMTQKGATVESSKDISVNGFSGQEFKLSYQGRSVIQRFIKHHKVMVNQTIMFNEADIDRAIIEKFLQSLVLS